MIRLRISAVGILLLTAAALPLSAAAATVNYVLRAAPTTLTMPDGVTVPAWGFALVSKDGVDGPNVASVPGPVLEAAAGDTLTVQLTVDATVGAPVSLLIPGQRYTPAPAPSAPDRMSTFTPAATNLVPQTYTFTSLRAGSYLYESGTVPAVQVPMGLYGALVVRPSPGQAYGPATPYDYENTVVVSELDPTLNAAVSGAPTLAYSTITSAPKYFLVNGKAYPQKLGTTTDIPLYVGKTNLLRLLNAGARSYDLTLPAPQMKIIAADGRLLPYAKTVYTVDLQAGRTYDILLNPTSVSFTPLFERRLGLTNGQSQSSGTLPAGGMLAFVGSYPEGQDCSPLKGDVNGDGKIDAVDVLAALRMYMGIIPVNLLADVAPLVNGLPCGDATITLADVLLVLRKAAGRNPY